MNRLFSWSRWLGIVGKEFIQLKRDRLTFAMIVGIPVLQLVLFGFAINSDPKHMPAAVHDADRSELSRSILAALSNSEYFDFVREAHDDAEIDTMLATGEVQFVVTIPEGFSRALVRGERPALLLEADATDPAATGNAIAALNPLAQNAPCSRAGRTAWRAVAAPMCSRSVSIRAITRRRSLNTTSCPASWA
jgi:ABC-2 type transport system permease protein